MGEGLQYPLDATNTLAVAALAGAVHAALPTFRFAASLGSHAVLQQAPAKPIIWGFGDPGASISVAQTGAAKGASTSVVGQDGIWTVAMQAVPATNMPSAFSATSGNEAINISDVLFGDVYVCGGKLCFTSLRVWRHFAHNLSCDRPGQSNMEYTVSGYNPPGFYENVTNASAEIAAAAQFPDIRLFTAGQDQAAESGTPSADLKFVEQPWTKASPASVGGSWPSTFSAVCWYFGRDIYTALGGKVPIGCVKTHQSFLTRAFLTRKHPPPPIPPGWSQATGARPT